MYLYKFSFKSCENLSCYWLRGWFFGSILCYKVQAKIKPYKADVATLQDAEFARVSQVPKRPN